MTTSNKTVRIFTVPQQFPCGPQSSCCGPIGQSEEEMKYLKGTIERETGFHCKLVNVTDVEGMRNHLHIVQLLRSFGPMALPIVALDGEVVSMGTPTPDQAVSAIREKANSM